MNVFHRMRRAAVPALVGWLFADLLLALAMIFLVANASGEIIPIPPTPAPTFPLPTPTIPPPPCLVDTPYYITITIKDVQGLLDNNANAVADIVAQLRQPKAVPDSAALPNLSNRQAGLTLIYVGAPDGGGDSTSDAIFNALKRVSQTLGQQQGYLFQRTAYNGELVLSRGSYSIAQVQIYLFGTYQRDGTCLSVA